MGRRSVNKRSSHKAFKRRGGKTSRINLSNPPRGGIRL